MHGIHVADDNRVRGLLELACAEFEDQERLARFLQCGAAFVMNPHEDGTLDVGLKFGDDHALRAELRAATWGGEPQTPTEHELVQVLVLTTVDARVLATPPQG